MTEKEWRHNIAIALRNKMIEADINQSELAKMAHLSRSAISNYLSERSIPDVRAIINLSIALRCGINELVDFGERVM